MPKGSRQSGLSIGRPIADRTAVIAFLVGDLDFLGLVRGGIDIYEAHGRASKLYKEDEPMAELAPEMRKLCKRDYSDLAMDAGQQSLSR